MNHPIRFSYKVAMRQIDGVMVILTTDGGWNDDNGFFEKGGYKIISAAEYLKGVEDVKFKVGDRVECIRANSSFFIVGN